MTTAEKITKIAENQSKVFEAGKNDLWDMLQSYGNRRQYQTAFYGFNGSNFNPKYDIIASSGYATFSTSTIVNIECDIDVSGATNCTAMFSAMPNLKKIKKLICSSACNFASAFNGDISIEEIRFEGELGQTGLNLQWSTKLSKASITSIINALSTTTNGLTVTLSKTAKEVAFTADEWNSLIATKSNWTISLV